MDVSVFVMASKSPVHGDSNYKLTCRVSTSELECLNVTVTYHWTNSKEVNRDMPVGTNSSILSFSTLTLTDAKEYICKVNVNSSNNNIIITQSLNFSKVHAVHIPSELSGTW